MTKVKHTRGPWKAVRNSSYWEIEPEIDPEGDSGDLPFMIGDVCGTAPRDPDGGLQEANARLIAAAPDLLEALVWAMSEIHGSTRYDDQSQFENCCDKARAAIAKARGEA